MKFSFLFFVSLIMLVGSVVATEELDVVISPSSPDTNDDLRAYVRGYEDTTYDFVWMKNGATYYTSTGTSSTLDASYTESGDEWTVSVWVPESAWFDSYEAGDESVTITGEEEPSTSDGRVVVSPSEPCGDDDLRAYVEGYEDTTFDFVWMKNGATYYTSIGTSSTLADSYTEEGDVWTVSVWVPESAWFDSFQYGSESVEIQDCDGGDDDTPSYPGGDINVVPSSPCDEDDVTAYVEGYEAVTFDYEWKLNGVTEYSSTGTSSILDASETEIGDNWVVIVSVPESAWWDSFEYGRASFTVLDCDEEDDDDEDRNSEPLAADIHLTVQEGDLVDIDMYQYSNGIGGYVAYAAAAIRAATTETNVVPAYDANGDTLNILYGSPLGLVNGQWQTAIGDAGVYNVVALIGDGEDIVEVNVEITVEEAEITDENTAPQAADIHLTVQEGDLVDIDMYQYSNGIGGYVAYAAAAIRAATTETNVVPAYDAEGDTLQISAFDSVLNPLGQWQTAIGDAGSYTVIATISDGTDSTNVTIDITVEADEEPCTDADGDGICDEEELNNPPVLEPISDIEINEGEVITVTAEASDADGDVLTYDFENTPGGSINGATWTWDTTLHDAGEYEITATVNDGLASDTETFTVKVNEICDDLDEDDVCDVEQEHRSDYEGDLLTVDEIKVLNANDLYSAYDVSDMDLETSGVFFVDNDGYLQSSGSDDSIKVYLEMHNRNSFDARDITVTFILNGEDYSASFADLDRSEVESQVYNIAVPAGLETGKYPLTVLVENDDISYETAFNLEVVSLGDYINEEEQEGIVEETAKGFWNKVENFFGFLF